MKTLHDYLRAILSGICPKTDTGCMMEVLAWRMTAEGRYT